MTKMLSVFCVRRCVTVSACILLSSILWSQTTPVNAVVSGSPAGAVSVSKPHDDDFVLGNDDVLAINVWKEPDISRSIPFSAARWQDFAALEVEIANRLKNYISECDSERRSAPQTGRMRPLPGMLGRTETKVDAASLGATLVFESRRKLPKSVECMSGRISWKDSVS
jgi:hypothetical protein